MNVVSLPYLIHKMCSFQVEPTKITPTYLVQDSTSNIYRTIHKFLLLLWLLLLF